MARADGKRLLDRVRAAGTGRKPRRFRVPYEGCGSDRVGTHPHTQYRHPKYPNLVWNGGATRQAKVARFIVAHAVRTIDRLIETPDPERARE